MTKTEYYNKIVLGALRKYGYWEKSDNEWLLKRIIKDSKGMARIDELTVKPTSGEGKENGTGMNLSVPRNLK